MSHEVESLPQCEQRIYPVLNIYCIIILDRMILNSGRHTQSDPQSCRVRSLGGEGAQKQRTHQETKAKLSSATPNHDKTIRCQGKRRKKLFSSVAADLALRLGPNSERSGGKVCKIYETLWLHNRGTSWKHQNKKKKPVV